MSSPFTLTHRRTVRNIATAPAVLHFIHDNPLSEFGGCLFARSA
jgi:hypothetical protein